MLYIMVYLFSFQYSIRKKKAPPVVDIVAWYTAGMAMPAGRSPDLVARHKALFPSA